MTAGERWRVRRNLVICAASKAGLSLGWIAGALCLSRQRVSSIVREYEAKYGRISDRGEINRAQAAKRAKPSVLEPWLEQLPDRS